MQATLDGWAAEADQLRHADPALWPVHPDWKTVLTPFWASATGQALLAYLQARLQAGAVIYPPEPLRALALTALQQTRVVILGQDPYHGPGQAEGLAFSVAPGVRLPPSLRNIFKELAREAGQPFVPPAHGSLLSWAQQGVLLLNTCLTVEQGQAASHAKRGWEVLTASVVETLAADAQPKVFVLWGAHAQAFAPRIQAQPHGHALLMANHPSPLSALRPPTPFLGCGHFGVINQQLQRWGQPPITWRG